MPPGHVVPLRTNASADPQFPRLAVEQGRIDLARTRPTQRCRQCGNRKVAKKWSKENRDDHRLLR
jgi:hypothetical protein